MRIIDRFTSPPSQPPSFYSTKIPVEFFSLVSIPFYYFFSFVDVVVVSHRHHHHLHCNHSDMITLYIVDMNSSLTLSPERQTLES